MPDVIIDPIGEVYRFTKYHISFHQFFSQCYEHLFDGAGELCHWQRHYIGLMAAARHRCLVLMDYHRFMFQKCGGDPDWLTGINCADVRFQQLDVFNRLLAHQPWMLNASYIHNIIGKGTPDAKKTFTLHELNDACILLAQTHVLCTFICAIGIERRSGLEQKEIDFLRCDDEEYIESRNNKENNYSGFDSVGEVERLVQRMIDLEASTSQQQQQQQFGAMDGSEAGGDSPESASEEEENAMPMFSNDPHYCYTDFQNREDKSVKAFKIHEFSWDHGFNLISDLSYETAKCLDDQFSHIQRLTYKFMGSYESIDTTKYREAVWNYIQGLFGIRYDDYDYAKVNVLLDKSTKTFIKNAACFPHKLRDDIAEVMSGFQTSEKIHVVIIVMEARFQAILLHFTRALCNYNAQTMARKGYRRPLD